MKIALTDELRAARLRREVKRARQEITLLYNDLIRSAGEKKLLSPQEVADLAQPQLQEARDDLQRQRTEIARITTSFHDRTDRARAELAARHSQCAGLARQMAASPADDAAAAARARDVRRALADEGARIRSQRRDWRGARRRTRRELDAAALRAARASRRLSAFQKQAGGRFLSAASAVIDDRFLGRLGAAAEVRARLRELQAALRSQEGRLLELNARLAALRRLLIAIALVAAFACGAALTVRVGVRKVAERKRTYGRVFLPHAKTVKKTVKGADGKVRTETVVVKTKELDEAEKAIEKQEGLRVE